MNMEKQIENTLQGIKKTDQNRLKKLDIETQMDLLYHFPVYYTNSKVCTDKIEDGSAVALIGVIKRIGMRKSWTRGRKPLAEATIETDSETIQAIWLNQPYLAKMYKPGNQVIISGKAKVQSTKPTQLINPTIQHHDPEAEMGEEVLHAVYKETRGITSRYLSIQIKKMLEGGVVHNNNDPIPEVVRKKYRLPALQDALFYIHFPRTENEHQAAKKRFVFERTFLLQLQQQITKSERLATKTYPILIDLEKTKTFMRTRFEFTPTKDQQKSIEEILQDIQKDQPMARLLEGDVGSGKTAVAAAVIHGVVTATEAIATSAKPQVAYLAPTETLARQQFETLITLFKNLPIQIGLISGKNCLKYPSKVRGHESTPISKPQLKKWVTSGEIAIVVGTHAVIQKDVNFKKLALLIIDEQHRFGVAQRHHLISSTTTHTPHLLSMTATPIPRTFALTIYGDLDISVIEQMPKGRKPVQTKLLHLKDIKKAYEHIREEVQKGHQAYVLCPRIDLSNDASEFRSVAEEYENLTTTIFPDLAIGSLHGKMKPKEKQEAMEMFRNGATQVLVCTTIVEVGLNIPNATIIVILHAERFGLAQLHQLRGRVIRSTHQPYCYIVSDSTNEVTLERLQIFKEEHRGLTLAKRDLDLRGSGELMGIRQSGIPDLVMEGLQNPKLLEAAKKEAQILVHEDPSLSKHTPTTERLEKDALQQRVGFALLYRSYPAQKEHLAA